MVDEVEGDLPEQDVDTLVNPWNRNFVPRWILLGGGVSGQLKKRTGPQPWRELAKQGLMPLGSAHVTSGGRMPVDLIHVAGLNLAWRATPTSVQESVRNAVDAAWSAGHETIAMPLIGAGHGGLGPGRAHELIREALAGFEAPDGVLTVRTGRANGTRLAR